MPLKGLWHSKDSFDSKIKVDSFPQDSLIILQKNMLVWTIRDFCFLFQYQTTPDVLTRSF
jgi:hypothetical protein